MARSARATGSLSAVGSNRPTVSPSASQPSSVAASDKENASSPHRRSSGPDKRRMAPSEDGDNRGSKRRRTENGPILSSRSNGTRSAIRASDANGGIGTQAQTQAADAPGSQPRCVKFFDPTQDEVERREVKRKSRALERELKDNRDEYLNKDSNGLLRTIERANEIYSQIKQTSDATLDSRLIVNVSDLAQKRSAALVLGDTSTGIDVDDFVSKCISFMRREAPPAATQARHQRRLNTQDDGDENEEEEATLDWSVLGSKVCLPNNLRPAVPGFLLGPLSVQKKTRAATQRTRRSQKDNEGNETHPESLTRDDLQTNTDSTVTAVCNKIKTRLREHCTRAATAVEDSVDDTMTDDQIRAEFRRQRITPTGGPSLFDFVINPHDFGQTVENLFYVSFLIKEGEVGIEEDQDGLPTLALNQETMHESRERRAMRHQAVFGIDYATWKDLVDAFDISEPLIPTRRSEIAAGGGGGAQVGERGWYA